MSLDAHYRNWEVASTWSGSLSVEVGALTWCEYLLTGRDVVRINLGPRGPRGWRAHPMTMGGRVSPEVHEFLNLREDQVLQGPDPGYFELSFGGVGLTFGWPAGAIGSTPSFASHMFAFWGARPHHTARSFAGKGWVVDISEAVISGVGAQLLIFPTFGRTALSPMGIIGVAISVADLIIAICEERFSELRDLFPTAAIIIGSSFGLGRGATLYEGIFRVSETNPPSLFARSLRSRRIHYS